ncbi:MAG TPA: thioredoxin domain-containing protein [Frankiaceae bacterium]
MPNKLATSTSPYLLQHADNPVAWQEWGPEAFAEAKDRNVPVLLSVGYAACHWCHVMAHESFEDPDLAAYLNEHFVPVKVDREERPDVDAVYMEVTQALTGSGGWPMTVVLTPEGDAFHAGTYYPPRPGRGMPSFRQLLEAVTAAWTDRNGELVTAAQDITRQLSARTLPPGELPPDAAELDAAVAGVLAEADPIHGAFRGAPKFPPSLTLEWLLRHWTRTGDEEAWTFVRRTCERMARSGTYDQLAGGFARYSVDERWVVPHFEKMLYDNALLARVYLHVWRAAPDEATRALALRVARETLDFLIRDLGTPEGGFASALDADTPVEGHGVEGATYVWTLRELRDLLGEEDGLWAAAMLKVTPGGTFEHGASTLQRPEDPDDEARFADALERLRKARAARPQPARDDKVVAAWNGLAVAALAEAGALLDEPEYTAAAVRCAELLLRVHLVDGRLRRVSRDGRVGVPAGVLEDYGDVAEGLLALHQATGVRRWLDEAVRLLDTVLEHFADPGATAFYDTADDAEQLAWRPADPTDNATPSGTSAAAGALLTAAALTGSISYRDAAERAVANAGTLLARAPRFAGQFGAVAEALLAGPLEVAVVGRPDLLAIARRSPSPGMVVVPGEPGTGEVASPLLTDRPEPAAYVCRGMVCERPETDAERLAGRLGVRAG